MNREIKFRIWDGEEFIYTEKYKELICGEPDFCICGDFSAFSFDNGRDWSNGVFQQFTGLKDKNGREIYEGDIIKRTNKSFFSGKDMIDIGCVEYSVCEFILNFSFGQVSNNINDQRNTRRIFDDGEIIGNIFENSDLLK